MLKKNFEFSVEVIGLSLEIYMMLNNLKKLIYIDEIKLKKNLNELSINLTYGFVEKM